MIQKIGLSGAPAGNRGIKIAATATPGTTIHTAIAGTQAGTYDELWLWAYNSHSADVVVTIENGGTTAPDDTIKFTVPFQQGLFLIAPGLSLQNTLIVKAFAGTTNVVVIHGFVNRIS